jgi:hypothetical protein
VLGTDLTFLMEEVFKTENRCTINVGHLVLDSDYMNGCKANSTRRCGC